MKRALIVLLMACAACGAFASGAKESTSGAAAPPTADLALSQYPDVMNVTCAYYIGTASPVDPKNNPTVSYVRDKCRVDLSGAIFLAGDDPATKMSLMVASKDMPDVVNFGTSPAMNELMWQFSAAGMLLDMEPLHKYMPDIAQHYTDAILNAYRSPKDGKLYCVQSFTVNPDNKKVHYTIEPNLGLVVRKDLMDNLGMKAPKTMDDLYKLLVAFKGLPDVNGKKMMPLQPLQGFDDVEMLIGAGFGIWKHRKDMNVAEKRTVNLYESPEYLEFLKYTAKLYRDGLIDPELFTVTYQKAYEKVGEGRVGIYVEWPNGIGGNNRAVQRNIPTALYESISVPRVAGLGSTAYWPVATFGWMTTIVNKNFKDPVRLAKLFDWMCTTEGWATVAWGAPSKEHGPWYQENGQYYWNKDVLDKESAADPSYGAKLGGWVYFLVGQLIYLPEDIGLQWQGGTNPPRTLAKERNIDDIFVDQQYEQWQAIPMGPVETEKGTAINTIFSTMKQQIVSESKSDAEVVTKYNEMMNEAKKAGLIEVLRERYQRIQDFQAKQKK